MIYTTSMLMNKYKDYANPKNKIKRLCDEEKLIHICHGLYEDNKKVEPYLLQSYIYGPSYISFAYVLSQYGLIPEMGSNITCATFNKEKKKRYINEIGNYLYRDIPKDAFFEGVKNVIEDGYSYNIALPEKALCDYLCTNYQSASLDDFKAFLFDDLRIDEEEFEKLDFELLLRIANLYKKKNHKFLIDLIKEEYANGN